MNNERPQRSRADSGWNSFQSALDKEAVVLAEDRPYAQDSEMTLVLPDDEPTKQESAVSQFEPPLTSEQYSEFDKTTREGERIRDLWHRLQVLDASLRLRREYNVPVPSEGPARPNGLAELSDLPNFLRWAKDSGLKLDFDALTDDAVSNADLDKALELVNNTQSEILHVREQLIRHPKLRFLSEVTVMRAGRDDNSAYLQPGWVMFSLRGDGRVTVLSEEQSVQKFVTIDELISWQDQPQSK